MSTSYTPERGGQEYTIPAMEDPADAPLAFEQFADSMPPQLVPVKNITSPYQVVTGDNGYILVSDGDCLVTFAPDLPEGFNVALTLSAAGIIGMEGVIGEENIPFEKIGSVVKAGGILYSSVSIGEVIEVEGSVGGPTAPTSISVNGSVVTSGPAGAGEAGPVLAYGAKVKSAKEDDNFTWDLTQPANPTTEGPEVVLSGTSPFTDYQVEIFGLNIAGRGEGIWSDKFEINYNKASGGTETIVDHYNGTGEQWKVHTFTADGTFTALEAPQDFRVLIVGGGGPTGVSVGGYTGGGGGGGGVYANDEQAMTVGDSAVVVGAGGSRGHWPNGQTPPTGRSAGEPSSLEINGVAVTCGGGGTGSSGPDGGGATGPTSGANGGENGYSGGRGGGPGYNCTGGSGKQLISNITGSDDYYSYHNKMSTGAGNHPPCGVSNGQQGIVIVAYQIGMSTTREIAQAQAEKAARAAGVEQGIEQGIEQGYSQAQEDLQEELTSLRTQIAEAAEGLGDMADDVREIEE